MAAFVAEMAQSLADAVREAVEVWYGLVLLLVFGLAVGVTSIVKARRAEESVKPPATGPGGRPLPCTKRRKSDSSEDEAPLVDLNLSTGARLVFVYGSLGVVFTFFADMIRVIAHIAAEADLDENSYAWWCGEEIAIYLVSGCFVHVYIFIYLLEGSNNTPDLPNFIFWSLALALELVILIAAAVGIDGPNEMLRGLAPNIWKTKTVPDKWDYTELAIASVRIGLIAFLAGLYAALHACNKARQRERRQRDERRRRLSEADETTPLVGSGGAPGYNTTTGDNDGQSQGSTAVNSGAASPADQGSAFGGDEEAAGFYRPSKLPHKTWWEYMRGYSLFFPYLWPRETVRLQLIVLVCFLILVGQRVVNILVPNQIGVITDELKTERKMPWRSILVLIMYKILQGQSGVLGSVRALLWIPVSQYSYRSLTSAAFEHVHSLSLQFHTNKRTGEILSALNKGAAINSFLEQVTFQVFPMLVDLFVAIVYFLVTFGRLYATIATVVTVLYLHMTVRMASARADQRRDMVNADREEEAVKNDSIQGYETVKYFNAEAYEFNRYRQAVKAFQEAEAQVTWGMNNMNICQALVFMCGILAMLMLAAFEVTQQLRSVGDFMVMITYLGQLQGPLNFFGTFYRTVQQAMISGERLLELFKIQPSVTDRPGVVPLQGCRGHIRWSNVRFWYEGKRPALRDLSFECLPGTTTAFVGESGGGKSTIFRLMFRYYSCHEGVIQIDGHDVKDLTIDSVRRFIGVVPQDTILFNESIMYNLRYANPNASDEEVFEACRAASIHDRILSLSDGYNTRVGDRGTRLSGGEKQRLAIARTILKRPKIIMLDEATSALDSETEQQIQAELIRGHLGQDRTLLIIAHRLSTITHADQIIVLHGGAIVERGTHSELLALRGRYAAMWEKQSQAEQAAEEARDATYRANRLLRQAHICGGGGHAHCEDASDGYNSMASSTILPTGPPSPRAGSISRSSEDLSASDDDDDEPKATVTEEEEVVPAPK